MVRRPVVRKIARGVRSVGAVGWVVLGRLVVRRRQDRARLGAVGALPAAAPTAAGYVAVLSFPAVFLAAVATRGYGATGVSLPPLADAHAQLWCVALGLIGAVIALDCWYGLGTSVQALGGDGVSSAIAGVTIALAVTSPMLIFDQVESRPAWLGVFAAQLCWPVAGAVLGRTASSRRKRRLHPPAPPRSRDRWLAEYGIYPDRDVVLVSPGGRRVLVAEAVRTLTGMRPKEAADLVDSAPGLVMRQVTGERAERRGCCLRVLARPSASAAVPSRRSRPERHGARRRAVMSNGGGRGKPGARSR